MTVPFMRAYTELLVQTCHRRGAHAIGGMAAFIPSRRDPEVNERPLRKVREDKEREAGDGFDGTWVAHPDLVPVAQGGLRPRARATAPPERPAARGCGDADTADSSTPRRRTARSPKPACGSTSASRLQYLDSWLRGNGAAAINNLMEDAATAEISRSQLWQWLRNETALADGRPFTADLYREIRDQEIQKLGGLDTGRLRDATEILDELVLSAGFVPFLTPMAYERLH